MPLDPLPNAAVAPSDIVALYKDGASLNALSKALSVPYTRLRRLLQDNNVPIRTRHESYCTGVRPTAKLTPDAKTRLVAELHQGQKQHLQLAREYGITRERVRQIAEEVYAPCGREVQRRITAQRDAERQRVAKMHHDAQVQRREAKYQVWRDLWKTGITLVEMAKRLKMSPRAIGVRITELRRQHPDWFPYRRAPSSLPESASP